MTNALLILIILALFLLLISFVIYKSSLPENDKVLSLILILVVFSFVAILNESKRSQAPRTYPLPNFQNETYMLNQKSFEKSFYELPGPQTPLNHYLNLTHYLDKPYPRMLFLYNSRKIGKTKEILAYIAEKQRDGVPMKYLDCEGVPLSLDRLLHMLKLDNLIVLDETLEKMNKKEQIPGIIFDNFNGFIGETSGLLSFLYEKRKVNLIIIGNDESYRLKNDRYLKNFIEFERIVLGIEGIKQFVKEANNMLNNSGKNINDKEINDCEGLTEVDYEFIEDYVKNSKNFSNFTMFCKEKVKKIYETMNLDRFKPLLKGILRLRYNQKEKLNEKEFSYGELKAEKIERFEELMDLALKEGVIDGRNGRYKILRKGVYSSIVMMLG